MSDSSEKPWSNNPYTPQVPYSEYFLEKANFAGTVISAILYGITIVVFFKCMGALFKHVNHTRGAAKWGLVAHTVAMFSFFTILVSMNIAIQPICYVDGRAYPGIGRGTAGPIGYLLDILYLKAINTVPNIMFLLNGWLADGILLYRCCVIYAMNYWVVAFPFLMYITSVVMGLMFIFVHPEDNHPESFVLVHNIGISYFSISLSLNVLLTLMIIVRLILQSRTIRDATGVRIGATRIYKAVVTMLIESFALYAGSFLIFIGAWGAGSNIEYAFFPLLATTQVIAPFLITIRVANRRALTSSTIITGTNGTLRFGTMGESVVSGGSFVDEHSMNPADTGGGARGIGAEAITVD